uniref:Putative secreted protein n=1 Tax=Ixodes ricinus TaxID=34613 RepID=A0A6B0U982_IXORI
MYCSISISVFVFLPSLKCIPVSVFPNTFCLYLKCISDTYRDTLLQVYFSMIILATILMYPSIFISKYIFLVFLPNPGHMTPVTS